MRKKVLTAGHCLWNTAAKKAFIASELHFLAGYDKGTFKAHRRGKRIRFSPDFDPVGRAGTDKVAANWAIIELEEPIEEVTPVPLLKLDRPQLQRQIKDNSVFMRAGFNKNMAPCAQCQQGRLQAARHLPRQPGADPQLPCARW
ncbi:MAG: trypsin-like serine protease [gamma proteobacterium symbiont of Phacoides pectinatus]